MIRRQPRSTLLPSTTLFRSRTALGRLRRADPACRLVRLALLVPERPLLGVVLAAGLSAVARHGGPPCRCRGRSEEHTPELQSRQYLVCRLLLEKNNTYTFML